MWQGVAVRHQSTQSSCNLQIISCDINHAWRNRNTNGNTIPGQAAGFSVLHLLPESSRSSLWPFKVQMRSQQPWNHVSYHSRSPKSKESPQKANMTEVKKPSDLPKTKKHKPMDSDEDDEGPQNEPGTSSNSEPITPVLPLHQGPAASSQGPAASANSEDDDSEYSDEYSVRSQDSGRTVLYPDLHVLTNDEHWTVRPETHKYAAAAGSFWFVTTESGEQQDVCNLTTMQCVQRSSCLDEVRQTRNMLVHCMATCGQAAAKSRCKGQDEISFTERNISSGSTRILQTVC